MYVLERFALKNGHRRRWVRYAVCGSRPLLERVRMGQKHPEHWRVVRESTRLKKAG